MIMKNELEILNASYWEHFKRAKELALYLELTDPRRVSIEKEMNLMIIRIKELS